MPESQREINEMTLTTLPNFVFKCSVALVVKNGKGDRVIVSGILFKKG